MARSLNKQTLVLIFSLLFSRSFFCQNGGYEAPVYKDYKDPVQFEKFHRRSVVVGAWQINTLKEEGAIVVKLKTNKILIDQLLKQGNTRLAIEKQLEQFAVNRNTMFAFIENFSFCKVYFMYSTHSDSLLNGARQGIFLDTNLTVDPSIVMNEKYYIIAERDMAFSSSIGFVREDSARSVREEGNPVRMMAIILKNKYGHQLKSPMPYATREKNFTAAKYPFPIKYTPTPEGASDILFVINRTYLEDLKTKVEQKIVRKVENNTITTNVTLRKEHTYEKLSVAVAQLNDNLFQTYKNYPKPDISRIKPEIRLFLY